MQRLAACPNIAVKIPGMPMTDWQWTLPSIRPLIQRAVAGAHLPRCPLMAGYFSLS